MKKGITFVFLAFFVLLASAQYEPKLLIGTWKRYAATSDGKLYFSRTAPKSYKDFAILIYNKDKTMKFILPVPTRDTTIIEGSWNLKSDSLFHTYLKIQSNGKKSEVAFIQKLTRDTLIISSRKNNTAKAVQKNDEIVEKIESAPYFPGGQKSLDKLVADEFNVAKEFLPKSPTVIRVQFLVMKNGQIDKSSIKIIKGYNEQCDQEVIRILQMLPKWKPGTVNLQAVSAITRQSIIVPTNEN